MLLFLLFVSLSQQRLNFESILKVFRAANASTDSACENDEIISANAYFVVLFRLNRMSLPSAGITSVEELIRRVRIAYDNPHIDRLTTYIGMNITDLEQARISPTNRAVIALLPGDHFFFPALAVGDVVPVQTSDRVVRVKTLSIAPRVFQWDGFLSDEECEHMIEYAKKVNMVESTVGSETKLSTKSEQRTSQQAWIGPGQFNDDDVFQRVRRRALEITRLGEELAEDTQVVHYNPGTHYYGHHDYSEPYDSNPYFRAGGNRMVTVLYYLNTVTSGGDTRLPYVNSTWATGNVPVLHTNYTRDVQICSDEGPGLRIQPKRGRAVMFYNLFEHTQQQGIGDPATFHLGCDPKDNQEKYMANQWVRNKRVFYNGKWVLYDDHCQ